MQTQVPAKLGVIGGGVMGEALLSRLLIRKIYAPDEVIVGELNPKRRTFLTHQYGVNTTADNREVGAVNEVVLLAIKPQIFERVAPELAAMSIPGAPPLLISILAGVTLAKIESAVPDWPVIRAMPNTPATVGAGITAIAGGVQAQAEHLEKARLIFQAVGEVVEIPEHLMDAVTGLSGSGPGYVAIVVEALTDGGVAAGLPRTVATQLALHTVWGTAQLLHETGVHPAILKDRVTSPGGTTIAGIAHLEQSGLRSALIEAVRTACQRSKELGA